MSSAIFSAFAGDVDFVKACVVCGVNADAAFCNGITVYSCPDLAYRGNGNGYVIGGLGAVHAYNEAIAAGCARIDAYRTVPVVNGKTVIGEYVYNVILNLMLQLSLY